MRNRLFLIVGIMSFLFISCDFFSHEDSKSFYLAKDNISANGYNSSITNISNIFHPDSSIYAEISLSEDNPSFLNLLISFTKLQGISKVYINMSKPETVYFAADAKLYNRNKNMYELVASYNENFNGEKNINFNCSCETLNFHFSYPKSYKQRIKIYSIKIYDNENNLILF